MARRTGFTTGQKRAKAKQQAKRNVNYQASTKRRLSRGKSSSFRLDTGAVHGEGKKVKLSLRTVRWGIKSLRVQLKKSRRVNAKRRARRRKKSTFKSPAGSLTTEEVIHHYKKSSFAQEKEDLMKKFFFLPWKTKPLVQYWSLWVPGAVSHTFKLKSKQDVDKHIKNMVLAYRDTLQDEVNELGFMFRNRFRRLFDRNSKQLRGMATDSMRREWKRQSEDQQLADREAEFSDTGDRYFSVGEDSESVIGGTFDPAKMIRFFIGHYKNKKNYGWSFIFHAASEPDLLAVMEWEFRWSETEWEEYLQNIDGVQMGGGKGRYIVHQSREIAFDKLIGSSSRKPIPPKEYESEQVASIGPIRKTKHETIDPGLGSGGSGGRNSPFWKWATAEWWKSALKRIIDNTNSKKGKHMRGPMSGPPKFAGD